MGENTYSVPEISNIVHGKPVGAIGENPLAITVISVDSRTVVKGGNTAFFALVTERGNGHRYIPELLKKGVRVFIVSEKVKGLSSNKEAVYIYVKDTLAALQKLASFHRKRFNYPVIGITGSNGKTIVKEWLYDILREAYSIARSPKSYNSQIGAPLSAWLLEDGHNLAILEAGISMPGEMEKLEAIIEPTIGIFTNLGMAHQENFGSLQQKLQEKLSLFKKVGKLIYCTDQDHAAYIKGFCNTHNIEAFAWGTSKGEAPIYYRYKPKKNTTKIDACFQGREYSFEIPFVDKSALENASHCFACCLALGAQNVNFLKKFNTLSGVAMRLEIKQGNNNCLLVNDYYNSDINSLTIALNVLNNQAKKGKLKKVLVLSDIQQSGTKAEALYQEVNKMLEDAGVDQFIGIGKDLFSMQNRIKINSSFYLSTSGFLNELHGHNFSGSAILLKGARNFNFEDIAARLQQKAHQTILEINMDAMVENLNIFRSKLKQGTKIMAMVKAFSYGSGTVEIANLLQFHKVDSLAVAVADEGIELRKAGINIPIVVMNPEVQSFQNIIDYQLEPNIYNQQLLLDFIAFLRMNAVLEFPVHIKIDTGMNRLGFKTKEEVKLVAETIVSSKIVHVNSVFSHLSGSDDPLLDGFTMKQFEAFNKLGKLITDAFDYKVDLHILNSAGIERFPAYQYDMVRLGIGLYGVSCTGLGLSNIGTLKTIVSQVKNVGEGETIGYSRMGSLPKAGKVAVIPIGYADGLRRSFGNQKGRAFVNGQYVPIVGNVCMDMCMLDVSGVDVNEGDEVEIFGGHISIVELAEKAGTIPYEILTGISQRVKRVYVQE